MRSKFILIAVVLCLLASIGQVFAKAGSGISAGSNSYDELKQSVVDNNSTSMEEGFSLLVGLSTEDLLLTARQASIEGDSAILLSFIRAEMNSRLQKESINVSSVIEELESTPLGGDWANTFFFMS